MSYGKSIELFLATGSPDSLVTAELSNWNGKAIKIPRIEVADCKRDDIKGPGVYFVKKRMIQTRSTSESLSLFKAVLSSTCAIMLQIKKSTTGQQP